MNVILCSDKKERHSKAQLSPSEVQVLLRGGRTQLAAPAGPGAHDPAGLQAPQAAQTVGYTSHRLHPLPMAAAIRSQRWGWGEVHGHLKAWAVGSHGQGFGALQDRAPSLFPGPLQLNHWDEAE